MKNEIVKKLIDALGYSGHSANRTAVDLLAFKDEDLQRAVVNWLNNNETQNIIEGNISTNRLMAERNMTFPAALIMINWIREDEAAALTALDVM